jgi:hypothetical protein
MTPKKTSHAWIGDFAVRLMQLKPGLQAGPAIHLAVQNHEAGHAMPPQMAAEQFATRQMGALERIVGAPQKPPRRYLLQQA